MKFKLEIDFDDFTKALVTQLKTDYEAQPVDAAIRNIPLVDLERSLQAVGDAAASMKPLNPVAFCVALNHYADCLKTMAQDAVKGYNDANTHNS